MAQLYSLGSMHVHPPIPPEEVIRRARKRFRSVLLRFGIFVGLLVATVIYCIAFGASAFWVTFGSSKYPGAGGVQPATCLLVIAGLGTILLSLDLRREWRKYREVYLNHGIPHFKHDHKL